MGARIPANIGRIHETLAPLLEVYSDLEKFLNEIVEEFGPASEAPRTVAIETPNSMLDIIATSAPFALIQMFFAILVIFFFLSGWTSMRKRTITTRASFDGAMTTRAAISRWSTRPRPISAPSPW
jgi:predicted PurR-regulated permease PerM